MVKLSFTPQQDVSLQIATYRPTKITYPLRTKGSTFMRFPLVFYLAEYVVTDTPVRVERRVQHLQVEKNIRIQRTERVATVETAIRLHRLPYTIAMAEMVELQSQYRVMAMSKQQQLVSGFRALVSESTIDLTRNSIRLNVSNIERLSRHTQLLATSSVLRTNRVHSTLWTSALTHHLTKASFAAANEGERVLMRSDTKDITTVFNNIQAITEKFLEIEQSHRLKSNKQKITIEQDKRLFLPARFGAVTAMTYTMQRTYQSLSASESSMFMSASEKIGQLSKSYVATIGNSKRGFCVDSSALLQANYKLGAQLYHQKTLIKASEKNAIVNGVANLIKAPKLSLINLSVTGIIKAPKMTSQSTSQFFVHRAGSVARILDEQIRSSRGTQKIIIQSTFSSITRGENFISTSSSTWLTRGTATLQWFDTMRLTGGNRVGAIQNSMLRTVRGTNSLRFESYQLLFRAGNNKIRFDDFMRLSRITNALRLDADVLLSAGTKQISEHNYIERLSKAAKLGSLSNITQLIKDTHYHEGDIDTSEQRGKLDKRLWFIRNQSEEKDNLILPSDFIYPVTMASLIHAPEGYSKFDWQTEIKRYTKDLVITVYDNTHHILSKLTMENLKRNWDWYGVTEQDVRLTVHTTNGITNCEVLLYNPNAAYLTVHQPADVHGARSWYAVAESILAQQHPIPIGDNIGLKEIPIPIEILIEFINILLLMWAKFFMAFTGQTGMQALSGLCAVVLEWIELQSSAELAGDNLKHYCRCYRWLRWESEKLMEQAKFDPQLSGNLWMEYLLEELIDYMLQHHFDYMPQFKDLEKMDEHRNIFSSPDNNIPFVLDKYKGVRNRRI